LQYRLAGILYNQGEHEPAARSLEMVIGEPSGSDTVRAGAFLQLILILAENGMQEPARYRLRQFEEIFPNSPLLESARAKAEFRGQVSRFQK
jgi:TolA-binding protein